MKVEMEKANHGAELPPSLCISPAFSLILQIRRRGKRGLKTRKKAGKSPPSIRIHLIATSPLSPFWLAEREGWVLRQPLHWEADPFICRAKKNRGSSLIAEQRLVSQKF